MIRGRARDQGQKPGAKGQWVRSQWPGGRRSGGKDKRPETRGQGPEFEAEKSEKDVSDV